MPRWFPWAAVGITTVILGSAISGSVRQGTTLAFAGGAMILVSIGMAIRPLLRRPRDPYSLDELRRIHEEETLREAGWESTEDAQFIVCPNCGRERPVHLPKCPHCRCG